MGRGESCAWENRLQTAVRQQRKAGACTCQSVLAALSQPVAGTARQQLHAHLVYVGMRDVGIHVVLAVAPPQRLLHCRTASTGEARAGAECGGSVSCRHEMELRAHCLSQSCSSHLRGASPLHHAAGGPPASQRGRQQHRRQSRKWVGEVQQAAAWAAGCQTSRFQAATALD